MNNLPIQTYESVVQQRDALEKELADVAAENYALKVSQSEIYDYTQQFTSSDDREMWNAMHDIYKLSSPLETPVTDAFTRDLMAKGVESGAEHFRSRARCARGLGHHDRACFLDTTAEMFDEYAESLRKGINDAQ